MNKTIEFAIYLTGKDRKTVVRKYLDWRNNLPQKTSKVKRSKITGINLLDQALKSNGCEICPNCGKYKTLQGNGIIHQLCECGINSQK